MDGLTCLHPDGYREWQSPIYVSFLFFILSLKESIAKKRNLQRLRLQLASYARHNEIELPKLLKRLSKEQLAELSRSAIVMLRQNEGGLPPATE